MPIWPTSQHFSIGPSGSGGLGSTGSDVEIMKNSLEKSRATLREKKGLQLIRESSDTKLLNFFTTATLGIKISPQHKYDTLFKECGEDRTYCENLVRKLNII